MTSPKNRTKCYKEQQGLQKHNNELQRPTTSSKPQQNSQSPQKHSKGLQRTIKLLYLQAAKHRKKNKVLLKTLS